VRRIFILSGAVFAFILSHSVNDTAGAPARSACRAESENFQVRSFASGPSAAAIAASCDDLIASIHQRWRRSAKKRSAWRPRCEVMLHRSRSSYVAAVGVGGRRSSGSSWIELRNGKVHSRRIDLLVYDTIARSALAHELTHVVCADWFGGRRPPLWIDEGMAILSDDAEKLAAHAQNLEEALEQRSDLPLTELFRAENVPSGQAAVFYAQSQSLVRFLTTRESPAVFVKFARRAIEIGYDRALRESYGMNSVGELQFQWQQHIASLARMQPRRHHVTEMLARWAHDGRDLPATSLLHSKMEPRSKPPRTGPQPRANRTASLETTLWNHASRTRTDRGLIGIDGKTAITIDPAGVPLPDPPADLLIANDGFRAQPAVNVLRDLQRPLARNNPQHFVAHHQFRPAPDAHVITTLEFTAVGLRFAGRTPQQGLRRCFLCSRALRDPAG